jgi:lipoprotein Spr
MAATAMDLCGTRFCLHGRESEAGLDCIGLAAQCLAAAGFSCDVPNGYAIRGGSERTIGKYMAAAGFERLAPESSLCEGDIVLVRPSPVQWHFMVRAGEGFVHAHAGLGRVVLCPGAAPWPIAAIFRLAEE